MVSLGHGLDAEEVRLARKQDIARELWRGRHRASLDGAIRGQRHLRLPPPLSVDRVAGEAAPIKRYLQSAVETMIARRIIAGDVAPGSTLLVDLAPDGSFTL